MTEAEYRRKLSEVDRLLNDPEQCLDPNKVWSLLADIAADGASFTALPQQPPDYQGSAAK
jgi:hypothetical protein